MSTIIIYNRIVFVLSVIPVRLSRPDCRLFSVRFATLLGHCARALNALDWSPGYTRLPLNWSQQFHGMLHCPFVRWANPISQRTHSRTLPCQTDRVYSLHTYKWHSGNVPIIPPKHQRLCECILCLCEHFQMCQNVVQNGNQKRRISSA